MASEDDGSRIDAVLEKIAPWRNATVMLGLVGLLLFAFQLPEARPGIAHGLMYGLGPLLVLLAWTRARDASAALSVSWLSLGALVCAASGFAASHGIAPGEPAAEVRLSGVSDAHDLPLPEEGADFRLRIQGDLEGTRNARAPYVLYLSRDDAELRLRGELFREVREEAGRGGPPQRSVSVHQTQLHDATLDGRGPAAIALLEVDGLRGPLRVGLFTPFGLDGWWLAVLGVLLLVTLALEVLAARGLTWTPLTAVSGFVLVLGEYVALRYDVDQPLITFLGGAVFAGVAGGLGGVLLGLGATWLGMRK